MRGLTPQTHNVRNLEIGLEDGLSSCRGLLRLDKSARFLDVGFWLTSDALDLRRQFFRGNDRAKGRRVKSFRRLCSRCLR